MRPMPELPKVNGSGTARAVGSNHRSALGFESLGLRKATGRELRPLPRVAPGAVNRSGQIDPDAIAQDTLALTRHRLCKAHEAKRPDPRPHSSGVYGYCFE